VDHGLHVTLPIRYGIEPERFTRQFQGLDYRLAGVEPSKVVKEILG
jgi:hypothetical protein